MLYQNSIKSRSCCLTAPLAKEAFAKKSLLKMLPAELLSLEFELDSETFELHALCGLIAGSKSKVTLSEQTGDTENQMSEVNL